MPKETRKQQFYGVTASLKKPTNFSMRAAIATATVIAIGVFADNLPEALAGDKEQTMIAVRMVMAAAIVFFLCVVYWVCVAVRHYRRGDACEIEIDALNISPDVITLVLRNDDQYNALEGCHVKVNALQALSKKSDGSQFVGRIFLTRIEYLMHDRYSRSGDFTIPPGEKVYIDLMEKRGTAGVLSNAHLCTNNIADLNAGIYEDSYRMVIGIYGPAGKKEHDFNFILSAFRFDATPSAPDTSGASQRTDPPAHSGGAAHES